MLRRYKRIKARRSKPRPGRLKGEDLTDLRAKCFTRDGYKCVKCGRPVIWDRGYPNSGHMAHIGAKRRYGDSLDNVQTECFDCHIVKGHNAGGKPVPVTKKEAYAKAKAEIGQRAL